MVKAHEIIPWTNYPSEKTPLDEINLKKEDLAIDEIDNRVIELYTTKADKTEISNLFTKVELDESTGVIKFTKLNGSIVTIDTKLEKLAINFSYDATSEQFVITLDDGTKQYVDMSALITQYEFLDSDTIAFQLENGKVKAIVKEGSIQEKHLRPDYLADITVQSSIATQASQTAQEAKKAAIEAKESIVAEDLQTKSYMEAAEQSATSAAKSEANAKTSEENAATSEANAKESANKVAADKLEIDDTIKNSLLASASEILDTVKQYMQQAQDYYNSMYFSIDGGTPQQRAVSIVVVDGGTPQQRAVSNGIAFDGGTPMMRAMGV